MIGNGWGVLCHCHLVGYWSPLLVWEDRGPGEQKNASLLVRAFLSMWPLHRSDQQNSQPPAASFRREEAGAASLFKDEMCIWHGVTPTTFYLLMLGTGLLVLKLGEDGCVSLGSMGLSLEVNFHCNKPHCFINSDSCCLSIQWYQHIFGKMKLKDNSDFPRTF